MVRRVFSAVVALESRSSMVAMNVGSFPWNRIVVVTFRALFVVLIVMFPGAL